MILVLFEICIAILAGYGLTAIIDIYKKKSDEKNLKRLLYGTIVFGGLLLLTLVAKGLISDIYRGVFDSALKTNSHQIVPNFLNQYPWLNPNMQSYSPI
jgi:asparagine N-glycosylation enzyme membrane subunit Stt3